MSHALLLVGNSEANATLYYATHFLAGDQFAYLADGERRVLLVSGMEQGRARLQSTVPEVQSFDQYDYLQLRRELGDGDRAFAAMLGKLLEGSTGPVRVQASFPIAYADVLRAGGVELQVDGKLLDAERRAKGAGEIAAIEEAQRATERATAHALDILRESEAMGDGLQYRGIPLTSERLRTEIELSLLRDGCDAGSPIVAGGPGAADPHWEGEGLLRPGEAIVLDIFPRSKRTRYFADMTRTVVKGEPPPILDAMYRAVNAALDTALRMLRPGINGREVHEATVETLREHGFGEEGGPRMIHGTGHGVGLDIHEGPGLGLAGDDLREGDVVTVEPGLYDPGVGAVRIEDMVVLTATGSRNLTRFPKVFHL